MYTCMSMHRLSCMSWLEASQFVQGSYCQSYVTQHSHWLNQWHSVSVVQFIQKIMAGGCPVVVAQKQSIGCTNQVSRIWFTTAASHYIILYVCLITFKFVSFQCEARRSRLWMLNSVLWKLWMCFRGKYESSCCIRNNAFGKSSKQQFIYAAIAYEDILLPATWLVSSTAHHKYQYSYSAMKSYPSLHVHFHITVIDHIKMMDVTDAEIEKN